MQNNLLLMVCAAQSSCLMHRDGNSRAEMEQMCHQPKNYDPNKQRAQMLIRAGHKST